MTFNRIIMAGAVCAAAFTFAVQSTPPAQAHSTGAHAPGMGTASAGPITVEGAWTRQTPPGAKVGGGYLTITNAGTEPDRLVGGSVPYAGGFQIHEMSMENGVMKMRALPDGLAIPPGGTVALEPGGYHLMFVDMGETPMAGDTVPLTLRFEKAGELTVDIPVEPIGSTGPAAAHDHGAMKSAK